MPSQRANDNRCVGTYLQPDEAEAVWDYCNRTETFAADLVRRAVEEIVNEEKAKATRAKKRRDRKRIFAGLAC